MKDVDPDFDDLGAVPHAKSEADKTGVSRPALYLVGTPIGNLEDVTLRALRVLKEVDVSGFLPAKRGERRAALEAVKSSPRTQVFYEAPHRVVESLEDVCEILGESRHVVIAREVTKLHEEFLRGRAGQVLQSLKSRDSVKGEITLLIGKAAEQDARVGTDASSARVSVRQRVKQVMGEEKVDEKAALKKVAKERGVSKSEAYREWQRGK